MLKSRRSPETRPMPPSKEVQTILNEPQIGITSLRKFSKETLIETIMELKKLQSTEVLEIRKLELECRKSDNELEKQKLEIGSELAKGLFDYSESVKDHKYGPKAVGHVSSTISAIFGVNSPAPESPVEEDAELEKRVELARSQGMRWNHSDKRPERLSTVRKKVESWESVLREGREADLEAFVSLDYDALIKTKGVSEPFVVGLCEQMESELGIGASSRYLKVRYKRDSEKYRKISPLADAAEPDKAGFDTESIAKDLINSWWNYELPEKKYEHAVAKIVKYAEHYKDNLSGMGISLLETLTWGEHPPTAIVFDRGRKDPSGAEIYQAVKVHKAYKDKYEEFWQSYCKNRGW